MSGPEFLPQRISVGFSDLDKSHQSAVMIQNKSPDLLRESQAFPGNDKYTDALSMYSAYSANRVAHKPETAQKLSQRLKQRQMELKNLQTDLENRRTEYERQTRLKRTTRQTEFVTESEPFFEEAKSRYLMDSQSEKEELYQNKKADNSLRSGQNAPHVVNNTYITNNYNYGH